MSRLSKGLLPFSLAIAAAGADPQWLLMSRHGECASLDSLRRRLPELDAIAGSPQAFVDQLRRLGYSVQAERLTDASLAGEAWSVTVPVKELSLLFATAETCAALAGHAR